MASKCLIEKVLESGFELAVAGFHHLAVAVPDQESVAAKRADQEVADLEFTSQVRHNIAAPSFVRASRFVVIANGADEGERGLIFCFGFGSRQGFKVAEHIVLW